MVVYRHEEFFLIKRATQGTVECMLSLHLVLIRLSTYLISFCLHQSVMYDWTADMVGTGSRGVYILRFGLRFLVV